MRQKWEYKTWVFVQEARKSTLYEDGQPLPGSETPVTRAPALGDDGWELVSVAAVVGSTNLQGAVLSWNYIYWFKRPK
jgi:hypothetical protein